jgi:hypothetical protein
MSEPPVVSCLEQLKVEGSMAELRESLEKALVANAGNNYCTDCLAQAAGLTQAEEVVSLAELMRGAFRKASDRVVERGVCHICHRRELVVRLVGKSGQRAGLHRSAG